MMWVGRTESRVEGRMYELLSEIKERYMVSVLEERTTSVLLWTFILMIESLRPSLCLSFLN